MDIKEKVQELPNNSGVYIMKNVNGEIIYVGKAKNLKNRVSQYFQSGKNHTVKVKAMVSNIEDFEYIIVANEYEAFALENNLIKRYQPYYNILLKDGKSYPYIRINLHEDFPKPSITRKLKKDGAKYFGPYFAGVKPQELLKAINFAYPLRLCKGEKVKKQKRPCLNYDIGLCSAPCVDKITKIEYHKYVQKAIDFLNGDDKEIRKILTGQMEKYAECEQFESALSIRDTIKSLDRVGAHTLAFLPNYANLDCFAWASNGSIASISVLVVRGGRSVGMDSFHLLDASMSEKEAVSEFITQYYSTIAIPPNEIAVPFKVNDEDGLEQWLTERRKEGNVVGNIGNANLIYPQKGDKRKLLDMARKNAEMYLEKFVEQDKRKEDFTIGAVTQLGEILGMTKRPTRMECYDISNIGGVLSVASMVVFIEGVPRYNHYRKFRIKTVIGANDFASMQEVITRRLNEAKKVDNKDPSFSAIPDLIVIDGGKGQLSNAQTAMKKCGFNICMVGLAKREEEIYLPNNSIPIVLSHTNNSLKLMQRIRDESHRFAITFHRSLRNKVTSILEEIEGIGAVKRKNLIKHYKSIDAIKDAKIDDLKTVTSINQKDAEAIFKYFHES